MLLSLDIDSIYIFNYKSKLDNREKFNRSIIVNLLRPMLNPGSTAQLISGQLV